MIALQNFWRRFSAVFLKEFTQIRRDRMTFSMMVGVPILQLALFGFAINSDPKFLPAALIAPESSTFSRSLIRSLENTSYFRFLPDPVDEKTGDRLLRTGQVQFTLTLPRDFQRKILRQEQPTLLIEADATDPAATSNALAALLQLETSGLRYDLDGPLSRQGSAPPFKIYIHRRYNEENITSYNIVPGLIGVVLTMTMVVMTGLSMTKERERGTMESLLALPIRPLEVMLGKILPYVFVGYIQVGIILAAATWLFDVPILGSAILLSLIATLFIAANLAIGFTFSTLARNQSQAMQMSVFYFLPSMLLSGFMFPFRGMPTWAQYLGEVLPLTHFLRIVRGIMLKGNGLIDILPEIGPIALFALGAGIIALLRYRQTLD